MKHHDLGEDRDFEWEGNKTWGKMFKQPVVGTLNFEVFFNEDFSETEGVLRPLKMKFIKLKLAEKRTDVTPEYVEYQGMVRGADQRRNTCHRIYRNSYVEVLSGGEEGTLERKAAISPSLSEEEWKKLRGD